MKLPVLSLLAACAALPTIALADPPPWAPAHGYRAKQHRYVYYPSQEVYYAPETRVWYWLDGGRWRFGASLPVGIVVAGVPGVSVVLTTERPYEAHSYVVERFGWRPSERGEHDDEDDDDD
jgi:hypothetical protein